MTPYPQKRQPAKRMLRKEHETLIYLKDVEIEKLRKMIVKRDETILKLILGEK